MQEDSEFLITLHGAFAQQEVESISANVRWGVQQSMKEGKTRIQYKNCTDTAAARMISRSSSQSRRSS